MEAQTRLLRVLQEGEYTTVGGRTPIRTDVRIIAATHRELKSQIQQGLFREDLYYRLNVVPLRLPPLRERLEDVGDLVRHFLRVAAKGGLGHKSIETAAIERLKQYHWPGNVRELENMVRRLSALHPEDTLTADIVEAELAESMPPPTADGGQSPKDLSEMVERYLASHFAGYGRELPPTGLYDRILAQCLALDPRLRVMMATGLHQDPVDEPVFYWRLRDHARFLRAIGCEFESVEPRMSRDFLVVAKDPGAGKKAEALLLSGRAPDGEPLFEVDNRGDTLFVTLSYPHEIKAGFTASFNNKTIHKFESEIIFVAIKNGRHNGIGYFLDTGARSAPDAEPIPLTDLWRRMVSAF